MFYCSVMKETYFESIFLSNNYIPIDKPWHYPANVVLSPASNYRMCCSSLIVNISCVALKIHQVLFLFYVLQTLFVLETLLDVQKSTYCEFLTHVFIVWHLKSFEMIALKHHTAMLLFLDWIMAWAIQGQMKNKFGDLSKFIILVRCHFHMEAWQIQCFILTYVYIIWRTVLWGKYPNNLPFFPNNNWPCSQIDL